MKKLIYTAVLASSLFLANNLNAQESNSTVSNKLSPMGMRFLSDIDKAQIQLSDKSILPQKIRERYVIHDRNGVQYFGTLIKVNPRFDAVELQKIGVHVQTQAGNIWSVLIPINQLRAVAQLAGVEYIDLSTPLTPRLENSRAASNVDIVHEGGGTLNKANLGEGVVVGIVDFGFDYTHPTFLDTAGNTTRIKRVWDNRGNGPAPQPYGVGHEYTTETTILAQQYSAVDETHGTHVAGIAAGSGAKFNDGQYVGMAPMSDIVLVSADVPSTGQDNVLNGIDYIFNYAAAEGKPAVVNLSLGTHMGPHDGSSLFDQALAGLTGRGKIVVGAAGNEGTTKLHMLQNLNNASEIATFIGRTTTDEELVDSWGTANIDYEFNVILVDTVNLVYFDSTSYKSTSTDGSFDFEIVDDNNDTLYVTLVTKGSEFNGKPRIVISTEYDGAHAILLKMRGSSSSVGAVHIWNHSTGNGADLYDGGYAALGISEGDNTYTVGEIGATGDSIIAVGAYTTTVSYTDFLNNPQTASFNVPLGSIAPFSSRGPSADGRMKPEVSAPGNVIISSFSRFDSNHPYSNSEVVDGVLLPSGDTAFFGSQQGTSMAAPAVAGIIALWLENNPNLSVKEIKDILMASSNKDGDTGPTNNNTWGYGKIDAYAGLLVVSLEEIVKNEDFSISPNPAQNFVQIKSAKNIDRIEIFGLDGKLVESQQVNSLNTKLDLDHFANGTYLLKVYQGEQVNSSKLVVYR